MYKYKVPDLFHMPYFSCPTLCNIAMHDKAPSHATHTFIYNHHRPPNPSCGARPTFGSAGFPPLTASRSPSETNIERPSLFSPSIACWSPSGENLCSLLGDCIRNVSRAPEITANMVRKAVFRDLSIDQISVYLTIGSGGRDRVWLTWLRMTCHFRNLDLGSAWLMVRMSEYDVCIFGPGLVVIVGRQYLLFNSSYI